MVRAGAAAGAGGGPSGGLPYGTFVEAGASASRANNRFLRARKGAVGVMLAVCAVLFALAAFSALRWFRSAASHEMEANGMAVPGAASAAASRESADSKRLRHLEDRLMGESGSAAMHTAEQAQRLQHRIAALKSLAHNAPPPRLAVVSSGTKLTAAAPAPAPAPAPTAPA